MDTIIPLEQIDSITTLEEVNKQLLLVNKLKKDTLEKIKYIMRTTGETDPKLKELKTILKNTKKLLVKLMETYRRIVKTFDYGEDYYDEEPEPVPEPEPVQVPKPIQTLEQIEAELIQIRVKLDKLREDLRYNNDRWKSNMHDENNFDFLKFLYSDTKRIEIEIEKIAYEEINLLQKKRSLVPEADKLTIDSLISNIYTNITLSMKGYSIIEDIHKNKKKIDTDYKLLKKLEDDKLFQIRCLGKELESDLSKKPFFLFYGKPSYMINYHYVWYIEEEHEDPRKDSIIFNIIKKYSYPSCLAHDLTDEEKEAIRKNEYLFIKKKIQSSIANTYLIQMPRILYDLYNIIYRRENLASMLNFQCYIDTEADTLRNFINKIDRITDDQEDNIIKMNNKFLFLLSHHDLLDELIQPIVSTDEYLKTFDILYEIIVFNQSSLLRTSSNTLDRIKGIEKIDNIFNKRFKTILFQTLLIELGFIYDITNDKYILNTEGDIMILYRGYSGSIFSTLNESQAHSNSFNTSILNGLINDAGANTYNYMETGCHKSFYLIKKHFYSDSSDINKIFFIPPILPFLLLYGAGEYWHARSKIYKDATGRISGLAGGLISDFIISSLSKDELEAKFIAVVKPLNKVLVDKYYAKYLKYKQKYLSLKNIEK